YTYSLYLHDALPICAHQLDAGSTCRHGHEHIVGPGSKVVDPDSRVEIRDHEGDATSCVCQGHVVPLSSHEVRRTAAEAGHDRRRSEEHTSELQSRFD